MISLRRLPIPAVILSLLLAVSVPARGEEVTADQAAEAEQLISQEIAKVELWSGTGEDAVPLSRSKSSILHWTNPTQGAVYGDVFIWTKNGQARAVGSVVKGYSPFTTMSIEFQSFSREPLEAAYDGRKIWTPKVGDVEFALLEGAPTPSTTRPARLRRMRMLADAFSVDATVRNDDSVTRRLRMLEHPIFRYEGDTPDVLDGAIFAFVEGTDPELLIAIEALKGENGFEWQYAIGRMNSIRFEVRRDDQVVWKGDQLAPPWPNVRRPEKSYFFLGLGNVALEAAQGGNVSKAEPPKN
ncbi:MAG TPA: hypothetical protein VHC22_17650 [Pirellulales bacterium]|nr:hypothetical protein [Pirellulales bacterium]